MLFLLHSSSRDVFISNTPIIKVIQGKTEQFLWFYVYLFFLKYRAYSSQVLFATRFVKTVLNFMKILLFSVTSPCCIVHWNQSTQRSKTKNKICSRKGVLLLIKAWIQETATHSNLLHFSANSPSLKMSNSWLILHCCIICSLLLHTL